MIPYLHSLLWITDYSYYSRFARKFIYLFLFRPIFSKAFSCLLFIFFLGLTKDASAQETLAGLTSNGGPEGKGTVFNIKTNATGFTIVKGFPDWGKTPNGGLIQGTDGNYYGMTNTGGTYGYGTIFRITPAGALTVLHHFNYQPEGGTPIGNLTKGNDGNFYGLTSAGGTNTYGTIFKMTPTGVFTVIRHLNYAADGANPEGTMVLSTDGNFYGITRRGGSTGYGTVFRLTPAGVYTVIKTLNGTTDGGYCYGSIIRASDGNFYGITYSGGTANNGTIFKVTPTGVLTTLKSLQLTTDGGSSRSTLVQGPDGFLYGTCYYGGTTGNGTIFKISTAGAFTKLRNLAFAADGSNPLGSLIVGTDGLLYGMNTLGGPNQAGTIFKISTTGTYTVLRSLVKTTEGGVPKGNLLKGSDGQYYGMTSEGGSNLFGTIFKISSTGVFTVLTRLNGGIAGSAPYESLIQAKDNGFYGTTNTGGTYNHGTVFKICGGVTTILHSFNRNPEGGFPRGSLVQATDGNFYGLTYEGGTGGVGTIFKITPTGTFTILRHLTGATDGGFPQGSLIQGTDGYLYGMTTSGGTGVSGTVFKISTTGVFKVIRHFVPGTDGNGPQGSLIKGLDTFFYGMTSVNGRIFKISPNGVFTVLKTLVSATGISPFGSLVLGKDGNFYGTNSSGGTFNGGTIFKISPAGIYTVLRQLNLTTDGYAPKGDLVQAADGFFYGMNSAGGSSKAGTIFKISSTGVYTVLRQLNLIADGGNPFGSLIIQKPVTLVANPQSQTTTEDVAKAIVLTGSGGSPLTFNIVTQPKNGTVTAGTAANRTYTPKANYNGKDSFYFTVTVGCLSSPPAKVLITITAVNDAPVLATIGNKTVKAGTKLSFTATATDVDAGQTKTFSLISAPAGATIVASTGAFSWTPSTTGTYTFKVRVTDNGSPVKFDEEQITVTVTATLGEAFNSDALGLREGARLPKANLYPNPVRSTCTILLDQPYEHLIVSVTDLQGVKVRNWSYGKTSNGKLELRLEGLAAGQYLVKLNTEKGIRVMKLIKL